jgi:hypothetical protein
MIAWLNWLFEALFGCSHKRTTFPITPTRRSQVSSDGQRKKATYVVCLDCGKEFDYNWKEMRLESPAVSHANVGFSLGGESVVKAE